MPSISIGASGFAALEAAVLAFSTANPTARILGANFLCRDMVGIAGLEMVVGLHYDTNGVDLTAAPLQVQTFQADSPTDLNAQILEWETATVPLVESAPLIDYLAQRRRTKDYVAVVAYSMAAEATENWLAEGIPTSRSSIDDTDSPYAASINETIFADPTGGDVVINLPATIAGRVTVKRIAGGGNAVTVDGGANTIDGAANLALAAQYDAAIIEPGAAAAEWAIMSLYP